MSEELRRKKYLKHGIKFGKYEFYELGDTTINSLRKYNIVSNKDYGKYGRQKPDGLIVDRRNLNDVKVVAVIEYKDLSDFNTIQKKQKAEQQCNTYCQVLRASIGIATDTSEYIWINPKVKKEFAEDVYLDMHKRERWYSLIKNEDGYNLSYNFVEDLTNETETRKSLNLIKRIINEVTYTNCQLKREQTINPKNLAKSVWQSIWLASGENPDRCLATFVEIFIFKYLSDLGILGVNNSGVRVDFESVKSTGKKVCLKYYFENVREYIKELFPESEFDGTSVINNFILDPNIKEHNHLFFNILKSFLEFLTDDAGNEVKLLNIDPDFKTRLYEDFLKRSISQKNWGQFFTPRNVVKAMVEISGIENLKAGAKVCDPACGVGGFILEPVLTKRTSDYAISGNVLSTKIDYEGLDRDPKVIIMAKANMLIYLSELLRDNPTLTKTFANRINKVFKSFHSSILGSLSCAEYEKYDLIMSNPPYVTKGIVNYKSAISNDGHFSDYYKINGMGVECFFIEKMVNESKSKGTIIVIMPDGLLNRVNDYKIRQFIKDKCVINAIVSLPIGTFYSTQKKTYIISLTKKEEQEHKQTKPVFGYIASSIGESLDVYRIQIEDNDLKEMARGYKYFMADKLSFEPISPRCKLFPIDKFDPKTNWCVDRWWSREEKIELGVEEELNLVDVDEFHKQVGRIIEEIKGLHKDLGEIDSKIAKIDVHTVSLTLKEVFEIKQGDAYYTLKRIKENGWEGDVPVFSSNTKNNGVLVHIRKDIIKPKDRYYDQCLTWAIDGMAGKMFIRNEENSGNLRQDRFLFTINNHCGVLIPRGKIEFYINWLSHNIYRKLSAQVVSDELRFCWEKINAKKDKSKFEEGLCKILDPTLSKKCKLSWIRIRDEIMNNFGKQTYNILMSELLPICKKYVNNKIEIDMRYIKKNIEPVFFNRTRSYGNKKLGTNQIENLEVLIPVDRNGLFDVSTMKKIADEQEKLENIKRDMLSKSSQLKDMEVVFQVE